MNISTALKAASDLLAAAGVAEPRREAASLLAFALTMPPSFLIAHPEYEITDDEQIAYDHFIARRTAREPFQYILGSQEFWGLEFEVVPGVLIPRPETEILVEAAINILQPLNGPIFCEAGVGSGCISISILHSVPKARAVASDISARALDIAARNAIRHGVDDRLELREADLLAGLAGPCDIVVSNPPYISDDEIAGLQPEVRDHEPVSALAGGPDGLDIIKRIVVDSRHLLRSGGVLLIEIGHGQADRVAALFDRDIWDDAQFLPDLQRIPRVVRAGLK